MKFREKIEHTWFGKIGTIRSGYGGQVRPPVDYSIYHRVAVVPSDPQLLCVTPKHFAEHLDVLQKCMNPMPLRQLVPAVRNRKIPHRRVIVTFDDGYADNMYIAKPLLERCRIPATVFASMDTSVKHASFGGMSWSGCCCRPELCPKRYV